MANKQADEPVLSGHITIDGLEGRYARVELPDGTLEDWALASLPTGVKEGDVLSVHVEGGDLDIEIDHVETRRRRTRAQAELTALNGDAPDGEITL
ncbi:DUF3006 domain-containing protein [Deinococcus navajonensis]|uniref:DUF3006 domain-containing protein n=1 Tax=Deinococcus navajonensis TaxID=309884 RepID=A0ABV8XSD4_9DEIO